MAKFESDIVTPAVPKTLTVTMPGAKRGRAVKISEFTPVQLEVVGEEWTAALKKAALGEATNGHRVGTETA